MYVGSDETGENGNVRPGAALGIIPGLCFCVCAWGRPCLFVNAHRCTGAVQVHALVDRGSDGTAGQFAAVLDSVVYSAPRILPGQL